MKGHGVIGLPIYGFLLMFNSNIGPNQAPLRDIRLQNLCDLDFDLSRSLKVKSSGAFRLAIYDFILVSNSNYMSVCHRLEVLDTQKLFSYLLSLGPNFEPPTPTLTPGGFFSKSNHFFPGRRKAATKNKTNWLNTF